MMNSRGILYIKHADSSFILADQNTLEHHFPVTPYLLNQSTGKVAFLLRLPGMAWFVFRNRNNTKFIVTWFADYHSAILSFLGKSLKIPVIIFAGGQEAVSYPELGKGVYHNNIRSRFVKYALRNCSLIVPNHDSLVYHENYYYQASGKKDGIKYYIPDLKTPIMIAHNGIDTGKYYRDTSIKKLENAILTVGTMNSLSDFINKGFDLFIQLANRNPALSFTLIGIPLRFLSWIEEHHGVSRIKNLTIIHSFCPDEVLFKNYNQARIFVQASITEGMPNTLNEAMLCGCIPVGSDVNGIPDAIGNTGVIVKHNEIEELELAIYKALTINTEEDAIQHVLSNYTQEIRAERIISLLQSFHKPQ